MVNEIKAFLGMRSCGEKNRGARDRRTQWAIMCLDRGQNVGKLGGRRPSSWVLLCQSALLEPFWGFAACSGCLTGFVRTRVHVDGAMLMFYGLLKYFGFIYF